MTSFISVSTSAARYQDISLNPQKLAGQCAKLKCCLNYEVDCYVEAQKRLPSREIELETKDGTFYFFKADILSNRITYSTDKSFAVNLVTISGKRAFEIIGMNRKGLKPDSLSEETVKSVSEKPIDLLEQESLTRFDRRRGNKDAGKDDNNRNRRKKKKGGRPQGEGQQNQQNQQNHQQSRQRQDNRLRHKKDRPQRNDNPGNGGARREKQGG